MYGCIFTLNFSLVIQVVTSSIIDCNFKQFNSFSKCNEHFQFFYPNLLQFHCFVVLTQQFSRHNFQYYLSHSNYHLAQSSYATSSHLPMSKQPYCKTIAFMLLNIHQCASSFDLFSAICYQLNKISTYDKDQEKDNHIRTFAIFNLCLVLEFAGIHALPSKGNQLGCESNTFFGSSLYRAKLCSEDLRMVQHSPLNSQKLCKLIQQALNANFKVKFEVRLESGLVCLCAIQVVVKF